jgi:hypothetical protein
VGKEAERSKKVEHGVEPLGPAPWHFSHVGARVTQQRAGSPRPGNSEQLLRIVEPIDVVTGFGQQMCMTALSTWHVENSRTHRQAEQIDQARYFVPIALQREERSVLQEIVGIEC